MSAERLIRMANQIAANLAAQGEGIAATQTARHIVDFWDPSMRAAILQVDRSRLSAIARRAVEQLADR